LELDPCKLFRVQPAGQACLCCRAEIDGLQYRSRWDNSRPCWAVFNRAQAKLALGICRLAAGRHAEAEALQRLVQLSEARGGPE
jgi:hypothetical protein